MLGSTGGVVIQPGLGRAADVGGYGSSYLVGAAVSALALPFIFLSRRQDAPADTVEAVTAPEEEALLEPAGALPAGEARDRS